MQEFFDHEKLTVYQHSIKFSSWISGSLEKLPKSSALWNQLDRAATSIPLNIAEENGKWTAKDRAKFFDIARGSALECSAVLDVAITRNFLNENDTIEGKEILLQIVKMLVGLTKSISPDRQIERGTSIVGEPDSTST